MVYGKSDQRGKLFYVIIASCKRYRLSQVSNTMTDPVMSRFL